MKKEKRIIYRVNKNNQKLYRYDLKTKERRLATEEECERYEERVTKEIENKMKIAFFAFIASTIFLHTGKNGYTNADKLMIRLECLLNSEDGTQILWKELNNFIQNNMIYNKQEYTIAYQYLIENNTEMLSVKDLSRIIEVVSRDIFYNQENHPLIADCIKSIVAGSNGNFEGNIRLSIISDILGSDTVTYLLLTNQEEVLYKCLRMKLGLKEEELASFLTDLEALNRLSNKESIGNYRYSDNTKSIIASYVTIPIEKKLLKDYMDYPNIEPKFIPVGSFLSRKEILYPVCVKNEYLSTTTINVYKDITDNYKVSDLLTTNIQKNTKNYNEEESLIGQFLKKGMKDQEVPKEWLQDLEQFLISQKIDINTLVFGLEKRDPRSLQLFLDSYLTWFSKKEIDVSSMCELNYTIQSLQNKKEESMLNYRYFREMLEWFQKETIEICKKQEKEEYKYLINKGQIIFKESEVPIYLLFNTYETKQNATDDKTHWEIVIPIEDREIKPNIRIKYTDGRKEEKDFDSFRNDWEVIQTDQYIIYSTRKQEDENIIGPYITIKDYLETKRKGKERKRICN